MIHNGLCFRLRTGGRGNTMAFNPNIVIFSNYGIPSKYAAYSYGPIILVRPKFKDDLALIHHEQVHSRQFWRTFGLHGVRYMFSKEYRFKSEVEAYGEQVKKTLELKQRPNERRFAKMIATLYRLDVTEEQALDAIYNYINTGEL